MKIISFPQLLKISPVLEKNSPAFYILYVYFVSPPLWLWCLYASPNARTGRLWNQLTSLFTIVNECYKVQSGERGRFNDGQGYSLNYHNENIMFFGSSAKCNKFIQLGLMFNIFNFYRSRLFLWNAHSDSVHELSIIGLFIIWTSTQQLLFEQQYCGSSNRSSRKKDKKILMMKEEEESRSNKRQ